MGSGYIKTHTADTLHNNCEQTHCGEVWWVKLECAGESVN